MKLIEQIRKADAKKITEIKKEPMIEKGERTTSCGVPDFILEIDKFIFIKAIAGTKRLHEIMQFEMENDKKYIWPVETVLTQDYKTLVSFYNIIRKGSVLSRQVANDVQQMICQIRKDKASNERSPYKNDNPKFNKQKNPL